MSDWFSDEKATFGDRLAGAREAAGLSQETLARKLGVKEKTIRAWEDDILEPRANRLQILAGLLNVSLMWLLNGKGEGVSAPEEVAPVPEDLDTLLTDLRLMRAETGRMAERMGLMEKRLKRWTRGEAA